MPRLRKLRYLLIVIAAKSLAHLLMMSDVVPLDLKPTRNALGIYKIIAATALRA